MRWGKTLPCVLKLLKTTSSISLNLPKNCNGSALNYNWKIKVATRKLKVHPVS